MTQYSLSFAGAGRVAGALCLELFRCGFKILQVVSESDQSAKLLAESCDASWSTELNYSGRNDIIIVAVPDHKLSEVLSKIKCTGNTIIVHTAGSFGLEVFPPYIKKKGVFYPLQTFSKERSISFKDLPFLLEASGKETADALEFLTVSVGGEAHFLTPYQRRMLHLSAVFVNNFTNYMLTAGEEITASAGVPFELLVPLINETIAKALQNSPERSQTGPAVRNDLNTIEKHIELLSFSPSLQNIYREITMSIIKHYKRG
jgi:predicted short-subunit dehydrogenase-like oxidoreductase (DUF2520 family)